MGTCAVKTFLRRDINNDESAYRGVACISLFGVDHEEVLETAYVIAQRYGYGSRKYQLYAHECDAVAFVVYDGVTPVTCYENDGRETTQMHGDDIPSDLW